MELCVMMMFGKVHVLTMTRLVCFPARLRSAYGIGLLQDSESSSSSVGYSDFEAELASCVCIGDTCMFGEGWAFGGVCVDDGGNKEAGVTEIVFRCGLLGG